MTLAGSTTAELETLAAEFGHPRYRGRQIAAWVFKRGARCFDEMTDLPAALREQLRQNCFHPAVVDVSRSVSVDGTIKFLVQAEDHQKVECVFLPYEQRNSVCISTQVGCAMDCTFCATGIGGLTRNLSPGEIVDQVLLAQRASGVRISHVVFMGMGEPLANYTATVAAIRLLVSEVGISARRITVSTVGFPAAIRRLSQEGLPITLAVSLHAPNDDIRSQIMPAARLHPMDALLDACREWISRTGRKMTFEYLLLDGINDRTVDARLLAGKVGGMMASVNLIPYNHVEGRGEYRRPARERVKRFRAALESEGVTVTERMRRGNPIDAACGQLRHDAETGLRISRSNEEGTAGPALDGADLLRRG